MKVKVLFAWLTFLLISIFFVDSFNAGAATITVNSGDNLSQTIMSASSGDTVLVNPGTYDGTNATAANPLNNFWINKPLTLMAADSNNPPTLTVSSSISSVIQISSDNVTVEGFTLTGKGYGVLAKDFQNVSGGVLSDLSLRNLTINSSTSGAGHAIYFGSVKDSIVDSCTVNQAPNNGIVFENSTNNIMMNNTVLGTSAWSAIVLKNSDYNIVVDNVINTASGSSAYHGSIILEHSHSNRVERNRIVGNIYDGVTLYHNTSGGSLFNYIGHNFIQSTGWAIGKTVGTGIWINSDSNGNYAFANEISGFPENGLSIWTSSNNYVEGNIVNNNYLGGIDIYNSPSDPYSVGATPVNNVVHSNFSYNAPTNGMVQLRGSNRADIAYNHIYTVGTVTSEGAGLKVGNPNDTTATCNNIDIYCNTLKGLTNIGYVLYENVFSSNVFKNINLNLAKNFSISPATVKWDAGPLIGGNYWSNHSATGNPSQTTPYTNILYDTTGNTGLYIDNFPFESENLGKTYSVVVYEPYADSRFAAGRVKTIRWKSQGTVSVDITYSSSADSGTIATNYPDIGYYSWTVPSVTVANDYQITVSCKNSAGTAVGATGSSGAFSIASSALKLATPGRAFRGVAGSNVRVAWLKSSSVSNVDVYLKHSGGDWVHQGSSSGIFMDITLPSGVSSNQTSIRIADQDVSTNQDSVDGYFTISGSTGSITSIFAPDGGNVLSGSSVQIGDSYIIEWISPADSKAVDISFWDGAAWELIAQGLPDFGRYMWFAPGSLTTSSSILMDFKGPSGSSLGTTQSSAFNIGTVTVAASDPVPGITANGSNDPITLSTSDTLKIDISLDNANSNNADWWLAEETPSGWSYFGLSLGWTSVGPSPASLLVTHQGPLLDLDPYEVLNTSGMAEGTHTFYFGVDTNMNGLLDFDQLFYDFVKVNITP